MTWSIVAYDESTGALGVAVASKFFAVGAYCPYMKAGTGAVSTQSLVNPLLGSWSIQLLEAGMPAPETVDAVIAADHGRNTRQLHAVDSQGRAAAFTGTDCVDWAGHRLGQHVSVAGNMLAGPEVVEVTLSTYLGHSKLPLAERLLRAMHAGDQAGGDKRGRQGAALRIVDTEDYPHLDLRVDDHSDPIGELWRLYEVAHERFLVRVSLMPTRSDPVGLHRFDDLEAAMSDRLDKQKRPDFSKFWKKSEGTR